MGPQEEIAELKRQVERLSLFHEVGKALFSTLDLQKILQTIMEKISELLQPDTWSLLMVDERAQELYFEIAIGRGAERLKASQDGWPSMKSPCWWKTSGATFASAPKSMNSPSPILIPCSASLLKAVNRFWALLSS
jgi:GAF domain-containing protein